MRITVSRIVVFISVLAVLALAACAYGDESAEIENNSKDSGIHLVYHNGTIVTARADELEELLTVKPEEGFYCWGWTDEEGNVFVAGDSVPDTLYQQCSVKLGSRTEHKAYIFADKNGRYDLDRFIILKDVADMFAVLLTDPNGENPSIDTAEDLWIEGTRRMEHYGIEIGSVSPDETVTYGDLYYWLSSCYPRPVDTYKFSDVSSEDDQYEAMCLAAEKGWLNYSENMNCGKDRFITLREFIQIMNTVLSREADIDIVPVEVRLTLRDYPEDENTLCALAEATTDHSVEDGGEEERWTTFQVQRILEPGPRWDENDLYWVDSSGIYVVGREYNGFLFDNEGRYTSGNGELDEYVKAVLEEILLPGMSQEEKLKTVYEYSIGHFSAGGGLNYEWGTEDWWPEAALTMFKRGKGDCSSFAAVFCALARPLGYRMRVSTGQTFGAGVHSWAYMFVDGEEHIFDPQSEKRYSRNMFDMGPQRWKQFEYDPVYQEEPEINGKA